MNVTHRTTTRKTRTRRTPRHTTRKQNKINRTFQKNTISHQFNNSLGHGGTDWLLAAPKPPKTCNRNLVGSMNTQQHHDYRSSSISEAQAEGEASDYRKWAQFTCVFCSHIRNRTSMVNLEDNQAIAALLNKFSDNEIQKSSRSGYLCLLCIIKMNACQQNEHYTSSTQNFKYWVPRNARLSLDDSLATAACTVIQNEQSLSGGSEGSSTSVTNDEIRITNVRSLSPPLLSALYWRSRDVGDTESGGAFEKVQAKDRVRNQTHTCPHCNKVYQRQWYLMKHIRKLHAMDSRTLSNSRLKRSKSMYDDSAAKVVPTTGFQCPGCGKHCAPYEVFHPITCDQRPKQPANEGGVKAAAVTTRRQTRSMSGMPSVADTNVQPSAKKAKAIPALKRSNDAVPKYFICSIPSCSEYFPTLAKCVMHEHVYHRMMLTYTCRDCGDWFTSERRYQQHAECNHIELTVCSLCHGMFRCRIQLEQHLSDHRRMGAMNECRLCRRQFDDTASLLKHNRLVHKCKSPPKRIQILGRLGDRAPRNDLYVPTPYRVWERVQRRPTDPAERLPRAVGVPMRARRIRKRPGMMRGLRKPASNEWHRAVAAQWLRSEWRDGRLLANDKKGVNFWDFDHDQTVREEVTEQDVWWRRSIVQPAVVSDDTPLDLSKRGCLAVNPSKAFPYDTEMDPQTAIGLFARHEAGCMSARI